MWQCDWKHSNTHMSRQVFFFFGLKFCTNLKNKYENSIFDFSFEEKVIGFAKN